MDWSEWECESLMDAYRTDAEASYRIESAEEPMRIDVHKLGGGLVGPRHDGDWICELFIDGHLIVSEGLSTGTPKTHVQVSGIFADFLSAWADKGSGASTYIPEMSPYTNTLTAYAWEVDDTHGGVF